MSIPNNKLYFLMSTDIPTVYKEIIKSIVAKKLKDNTQKFIENDLFKKWKFKFEDNPANVSQILNSLANSPIRLFDLTHHDDDSACFLIQYMIERNVLFKLCKYLQEDLKFNNLGTFIKILIEYKMVEPKHTMNFSDSIVTEKYLILCGLLTLTSHISMNFEEFMLVLIEYFKDKSVLSNIWVLIAIQGLNLGLTYQHSQLILGDNYENHQYIKDKKQYLKIAHLILENKMATLGSSNILSLAWGIFCYINNIQDYKIYIKASLNNNVFKDILVLLKSDIFQYNENIKYLTRRIIYELLATTIACFDVNMEKYSNEIFNIFCEIIKYNEISQEFWKYFESDSGVASILRIYPVDHQITLSLLAALSDTSVLSAVITFNFITSQINNKPFGIQLTCQTIYFQTYCSFIYNTHNFVLNIIPKDGRHLSEIYDDISLWEPTKITEFCQNLSISRYMLIILSSLFTHSQINTSYEPWYNILTFEGDIHNQNFESYIQEIEDIFSLTLSHVLNYSSQALVYLADVCNKLKGSEDDYDPNITQLGLQNLAGNMESLELDVSTCLRIYRKLLSSFGNKAHVFHHLTQSNFLPFVSSVTTTGTVESLHNLKASNPKGDGSILSSLYERISTCYEKTSPLSTITAAFVDTVQAMGHSHSRTICSDPNFEGYYNGCLRTIISTVLSHLLAIKDDNPMVFMEKAKSCLGIVTRYGEKKDLKMESETLPNIFSNKAFQPGLITLVDFLVRSLNWCYKSYNFQDDSANSGCRLPGKRTHRQPLVYRSQYDPIHYIKTLNVFCQSVLSALIQLLRYSVEGLRNICGKGVLRTDINVDHSSRGHLLAIVFELYNLQTPGHINDDGGKMIDVPSLVNILTGLVCCFNGGPLQPLPDLGDSEDDTSLSELICSNVPLTVLSLTLLRNMVTARTIINDILKALVIEGEEFHKGTNIPQSIPSHSTLPSLMHYFLPPPDSGHLTSSSTNHLATPSSSFKFSLFHLALLNTLRAPFAIHPRHKRASSAEAETLSAFASKLPLQYFAVALSAYELLEAFVTNGEEWAFMNFLKLPPLPNDPNSSSQRLISQLLNFYEARGTEGGRCNDSFVWQTVTKPLTLEILVAKEQPDTDRFCPRLKSLQMALVRLIAACQKSPWSRAAGLADQLFASCPWIMARSIPNALDAVIYGVLATKDDASTLTNRPHDYLALRDEDLSVTVETGTLLIDVLTQRILPLRATDKSAEIDACETFLARLKESIFQPIFRDCGGGIGPGTIEGRNVVTDIFGPTPNPGLVPAFRDFLKGLTSVMQANFHRYGRPPIPGTDDDLKVTKEFGNYGRNSAASPPSSSYLSTIFFTNQTYVTITLLTLSASQGTLLDLDRSGSECKLLATILGLVQLGLAVIVAHDADVTRQLPDHVINLLAATYACLPHVIRKLTEARLRRGDEKCFIRISTAYYYLYRITSNRPTAMKTTHLTFPRCPDSCFRELINLMGDRISMALEDIGQDSSQIPRPSKELKRLGSEDLSPDCHLSTLMVMIFLATSKEIYRIPFPVVTKEVPSPVTIDVDENGTTGHVVGPHTLIEKLSHFVERGIRHNPRPTPDYPPNGRTNAIDLVSGAICLTLAHVATRCRDYRGGGGGGEELPGATVVRLAITTPIDGGWLDRVCVPLLYDTTIVRDNYKPARLTASVEDVTKFLARIYGPVLRYVSCAALSSALATRQSSPTYTALASVHKELFEKIITGTLGHDPRFPHTAMAFYDYFYRSSMPDLANGSGARSGTYLPRSVSAYLAALYVGRNWMARNALGNNGAGHSLKGHTSADWSSYILDRVVHRTLETCVSYLCKPLLMEQRVTLVGRWLRGDTMATQAPICDGTPTANALSELEGRIQSLKFNFFNLLLYHLTILQRITFDLSNLVSALYDPDLFEPYRHFLSLNFSAPQITPSDSPASAIFSTSYATLLALVKVCLKELELVNTNFGRVPKRSSGTGPVSSLSLLYRRRSSPFSEKRRSSSSLLPPNVSTTPTTHPGPKSLDGGAQRSSDGGQWRQERNVYTCLELSLYILISQAITFIKDPRNKENDKAMIKRELNSELNALFDAYPWPTPSIGMVGDSFKYYQLMTNLLNFILIC